MKINKLIFLVILLTAYSTITFGQDQNKADNINFCGVGFTTPSNFETMGNMIRCKDYVFTWTYEEIADLPRHKKELLAQINNPKEINVSVINTNLVGYVSKVDSINNLLIIGEVNKQGVIINLHQNKAIKSTEDLPECVRQFIAIKP